MKQLVVHGHGESLQTAVLENGVLTEFYWEPSETSGLVGNIYKGRIVNVLPGMQAAFVDIGLGKNAFLYVDDALHPNLERQPKEKPSVEKLLRPGQELLVQVMKEPIGGKGARVTTHISLPGRSLVFMPNADYTAVSKKISGEQERGRLRAIGEELRRDEEGVIMRTAAEGESEEALRTDLQLLREQWRFIRERAKTASAPAELHREAGLMRRIVRDALTADTDEVWIDDEARYADAERLIREMAPSLAPILHHYNPDGGLPIMDRFGVRDQLDAAYRSRIELASGGYLIWDQTEALTVIDVNTGKFTGNRDMEETFFQTNMEAADEIARLLRLRDTGGIIIVDFIDMELEEHRERIQARLNEWVRRDRTKCTVVGWTKLGLLEMTRKKSRDSTANRLYETCPSCGGAGKRFVGLPG